MELTTAILSLERRAEIIRCLSVGVSEEKARRKSDPKSWSILEVINHLYDEEREDFRIRLEFILFHPGEDWPGIDPAGWVNTREYNLRGFQASVQNFLGERARSIQWLRGLEPEVKPDLGAIATAPWGGQIRAGDMLAAWVAHDLLHIRQLVELQWQLTLMDAEPYAVKYAGDW